MKMAAERRGFIPVFAGAPLTPDTSPASGRGGASLNGWVRALRQG
jgi:hypothetical protein